MLKRMVNALRGSVRLEVSGAFPERFLNLCAQRGIVFWNVEWLEATRLRLTVTRQGSGPARALGDKVLCTVVPAEQSGVPFFLGRFRRRYALLVGLALSLTAVCVLSQFVLTIEVEGNEAVSTAEILTELRRQGLRPGVYGPGLDEGTISSAALLGIAFIKNIYGDVGMAPLMIIGSVPLYNVMAVVILSFTNPEGAVLDRRMLGKTAAGILKNPIILGILTGMAWSLLGLKQPQIMEKTVSSLAGVATPLGLMAMGASFDFRQASQRVGAAAGASAIKLVLLCAVFLPAAVYLGFREQQLVAILVMLGSAATVSCFVMARNMGHEGVLSSSVVAITTCGSAFTLTLWLDLIRTLGLI